MSSGRSFPEGGGRPAFNFLKGEAGTWWLGLLMAAAIVRLWVMPLPSSFWVDETGTAFVVRRGADDPTLAVARQVPASVYYTLPSLMDRFFGLSETAYRIPSLGAMALALWLIGRLAGRLIHPQAAWFAAFACLLFRGFNYQAADARPYALGTCVLAASLWLLVRWLDEGRRRHGLGFAVLAALLWRIHLVFWPLYGVYAAYAAVRMSRKQTGVRFKILAAVFGAVVVSLIPVMLQALDLMKEAGAHVVAPRPSLLELVYASKLGVVGGVGLAAALLARGLGWGRTGTRLPVEAWTLIGAWWLALPVMLFGFSRLTGHSIFVPRYLYLCLPGAALAATAAVATRLPPQLWKTAALGAGVAALGLLGRWDILWPPHHGSDWRGASGAVSRLVAGRDIPVACPSPYIEAKPPAWSPDYPADGFLYSHLVAYPVQGKVYPLPFEPMPETEVAAEELLRRKLELAREFVVYGPAGGAGKWTQWLASRLPPAMWKQEHWSNYGDVSIIVFRRAAR
ncbi:MAG: glycosyltransferase family 39 protein [Bryobacteraceae bacterium]